MKKDTITNFIKIDEKVFLLSDDDSNISLDIPFENSYTGKIKVDIEAESPIFIRNHFIDGDCHYEQDKDGKNIFISKKFCHYQNIRYIPATSIKGMIRNTLEIISYGKIKNKTLDKYIDEKIKGDSLHKSDKMDLSEAIFGTTSLKGRVMFSHFKEIGQAEVLPTQEEILATPQPKENKFGWKNYPILDDTEKGKGGNNDKVKSKFNPLVTGAKFSGYVKFHNLRDFELGALLSALTFHNTNDVYHNIGLGKSIGYGKIKINLEYDEINNVLKAFEEKINAEIFDAKISWHESPYIKELLKKHSKGKKVKSLSEQSSIHKLYKHYQEQSEKEASLQWSKIKDSNDKNDFIVFQKHYNDSYKDEIKEKISYIEEQEQLKEEAKRQYELIKDSNDIKVLKEYLEKYQNIHKQDIVNKIKSIKQKEEKKKRQKQRSDEAKKKVLNQRVSISESLNKKLKKKKR